MEECYLPAKLKRKVVNDDFCDFSLSSPATKIRRLDADLPPIIEEEEMVNPVIFGQPEHNQDSFVEQVVGGCPVEIDELSGSLPVNEERAIVLYDPINNMPLLQSRSPFSMSLSSDFLVGFKNSALWSKRSNILELLNGKKEKQDNNTDENNTSLAVVPWVPMHSHHQTMAEVPEMMDADDMEAITMDIEEDNNNNNNYNSQQIPKHEFGSVNGNEGVNQRQQHCMIQQPPHILSTPVSWSGTGV